MFKYVMSCQIFHIFFQFLYQHLLYCSSSPPPLSLSLSLALKFLEVYIIHFIL
jgi:hypothetical protein